MCTRAYTYQHTTHMQHTYTRTHTDACMHTHAHAHTNTHTHTLTHSHVHTHTHAQNKNIVKTLVLNPQAPHHSSLQKASDHSLCQKALITLHYEKHLITLHDHKAISFGHSSSCHSPVSPLSISLRLSPRTSPHPLCSNNLQKRCRHVDPEN